MHRSTQGGPHAPALARTGRGHSEWLRIGAALMAGAGLLLGARSLRAADVPDHHAHHHHAQLDLSAQSPRPTVQLRAEPDPMGGWNVQVLTQHFRFAPEHVNTAHVDGQGHAHLYVDGEKVARLYAPWFHLPALPPGEYRLRVTLNANSHEELAVDGTPLAAEIRITR